MIDQEIPITLTTFASIKVIDPAVLDLNRGEYANGGPFDNEDDLLEYLAVNLIAGGLDLSQMDGWADLSNDAVIVQVGDIEAHIEHELIR